MLRYYLGFIVTVGVLSSLLTTCGAQSSADKGASSDERVSTLTAADRAQAPALASVEQVTGNALTLSREWDGHFYADTQINGATIRMLVDTGATGIALSRDDARRAGIGISIGMPTVVGEGASGDVHGEAVTLDRVSLGGESAEAMPAVVLDRGGQSLLGQTFLSRFASVEIRGDKMVLR